MLQRAAVSVSAFSLAAVSSKPTPFNHQWLQVAWLEGIYWTEVLQHNSVFATQRKREK